MGTKEILCGVSGIGKVDKQTKGGNSSERKHLSIGLVLEKDSVDIIHDRWTVGES